MSDSNQSNSNPTEKPLDFNMPDLGTNNRVSKPVSNLQESTKTTTEKIDELADKAVEFAKGTAEEVKSQGQAIWETVKDKIEDLDENTKEFRENIKNKANEALEKIDNTIDSVIEKGKVVDEKEAQLDANKDGIADKNIDFGNTVQEKHGDFFDKAEKWLEKNEKITPHEDLSEPDTTNQKPTLELPKE